MMTTDLNMATEVTGYQRFLFVTLPERAVNAELCEALDRLGRDMENMHEVAGLPSEDAWQAGRFQLLRAEPAFSSERDIHQPAISSARVLIRLEGARPDPLLRYEEELRKLLLPHEGTVFTLAGVNRPRSYTSYAMAEFAYTPALAPQPGDRLPIGVVIPQNKTADWWALDWMQRESFFRPRYDSNMRLIAKGHALAASPGIPHIVRRTAYAQDGFGREDSFDFVPYFEFADQHIPVFREIMASLRDISQNPEWAYVREGPEWWGRRVKSAADLWESA